MIHDEGGASRRSLLASAGAALAGFGVIPVAAGDAQLDATRSVGVANVIDFGARGDGRSDDAAAFVRALAENRGGVVIAPSRADGYALGATIELPARTSLIFLAGANQLVHRRHAGAMFLLGSASRIDGGDHRGGGAGGAGFVFGPDTGQQILSNIVAVDGWTDPILDFATTGGSQSRVEKFSLFCAGEGGRRFAVKIADRPPGVAVPRHFSGGDFNGGASFDFGGCSIVMIDGVYCADMRFTDESRGVMLGRSRVGNQRALTIRGHDHILNAGWMPRLSLAPGADNCVVGGFFNAGYVIDGSGNGRNAVTYFAHSVPFRASADAAVLSVIGAPSATLSRSGSSYTMQFAGTFDGAALGNRMLYIELPPGAPTSAVMDQWGIGAIELAGTPGYLPLTFRVLPGDAGRSAMIAYRDGKPVTGAMVGGRRFRMTGTVAYSA